ncbi:hypothetical protein DSO57_1008615 [Entomophthora muscae]|uniref:Uncharacterized protein n=1 Tax=Entomophthora muscae TaxID=34485 RepID=A0ACC2RY79_9FUNG|nr:hypothetical protein DSO57_1008615 [Entomophthora muscae]
MSKIEFGVRSSDFTPLAFKTVINPVDAERETSFLRQVEGLSNVIQLLDTFEDDKKRSVLVLPVLRRLNLLKLDLIDVSRYAGQLAKALHGIHNRNIVHMDVTLSNLMADDDNNLVLIDFGLSTLLNDDTNCRSCGTPGYIAPEVFEPNFKPTPKVDIFGAGVILGCMLQPYITGCDLQYLGGSMVRSTTTEGIIAKLDSFVARGNDGHLHPTGSVYSYGQHAGVDAPLIVYQAAELLSLMLQTTPGERPTSGKILSHPFIQASLRPELQHLFDGTDYTTFEERRHMMEIYERQRLSSESLCYYDD